ncbi:MAG: hypothetical protein IPK19_36010 [Chloroflexi bacterium]|nr:hypothetical protein [Chloroflexota bacterium]
MARLERKNTNELRGFIILVAIVILSGAVLCSRGDLISPVQSTTLVLSMSSGEPGFAMAEDGALPDREAADASTSAAAAEASAVEASASESANGAVEASSAQPAEETTTGTMTLEDFTTALAAAGVDVEQVSTDMTAEGRSLDNLLVVVNSGRVTVEDLAARLKGDAPSGTEPPANVAEGGSTSLFDFRWEELGSVAYNLWFMLAATVFIIVIGRPAGWLVNRIKRNARPSAA